MPISTNDKTRESRLFKSMSSYIRRNMVAIFRIYTGYEPLQVFSLLAGLVLLGAFAAWSPFLWDWLVNGRRSGHLQSIILGGVLLLGSIQLFALGVLADLISSHRVVSQRTLERVRRLELELGVQPSHYQPGARARATRPPSSATTRPPSSATTRSTRRRPRADGPGVARCVRRRGARGYLARGGTTPLASTDLPRPPRCTCRS